ncbi:hypothetical protein GR157_36085 [Burkholderia sp. 4701]|nr:hypothetical protein [Burkholderia sp. 4701]MXN86723.1 hypothetical protein [Burkholderia sp. 4812]
MHGLVRASRDRGTPTELLQSVCAEVMTMEDLNSTCERLRSMGAGDAVDWLFENFPPDDPSYGFVFDVIPRISWRRGDQDRLARYYLKGMPFASGRVYVALSKIMSLEKFLRVAEECMPKIGGDIEFVFYYLIPALDVHIKSESHRALVNDFVSKYLGKLGEGWPR